MTSRPTRLLGLFLCALALAACNRQGPQVPKAVDDNAEAQDHGDGVQSVVVNPDAAKVGSEVDGAGDIVAETRQFKAGENIYISVPMKFGRKAGDQLEIFWFHEDGRSRKEDRKRIAGPFTVFEYAPADAGEYNVEVAANGQPIALVQFVVE